ncbi:hypothetical protein LUZ63_007955 [Rhynchospora breviuscula]|uniref:Uncharacterized protein n=1 Tax=Rhynchospora breviuscula TaxID=2022672 RepID=A0A9Q0CSP1_9POAL|nr:hypothetical protein LUZ63_007955 [Rhynchospora breviuscula]
MRHHLKHPPMEKSQETSRLDFGKMGYGCKHYRRRCKIRAPCCDEVFYCRHCHNESMRDHHEINRREVETVICLICDAEQPVSQVCSHCGVRMGEYFCAICKFFDDDISKEHYHCDDCGICRIGGKESYFHCKKCGSCYSIGLRDKHSCVENSMRNYCPICYEYLFDSLQETAVLKCGHTMHSSCLLEMLSHDKFCCPICSKSVIDVSKFWKKLDKEVEATIMPEYYQCKDSSEDYQYKVWILCHDCNDTTEVFFHVIGQKCSHCNSYNTRSIAPPVLP